MSVRRVGVPKRRTRRLTDIEAVKSDVSKRSKTGIDTSTSTEEVPKLSCEIGSFRLVREGRCSKGATKTEQNILAKALTLLDLRSHIRTIQ